MIPYLRFAILSGTYLPSPHGIIPPQDVTRHVASKPEHGFGRQMPGYFEFKYKKMIHILFFLVTCHRKFHVFHKKAILVGHVINQGRKIYNGRHACLTKERRGLCYF